MAGWDDIPDAKPQKASATWDDIPDAVAEQVQPQAQAQAPMGQSFLQGAKTTGQNLAQGVPLGELAANLLTSAYGIPASGLMGLMALPEGLDKSLQVMGDVRNQLIYQPQTPGGQQLSQAAGYPMEALGKLGGMVGGPVADAGFPNLAAGLHSAIEAAPAILPGVRMGMKALKSGGAVEPIIQHGIEKGIRPTVVGKRTHPQYEGYIKRADTAVKTIIENKPNLKLTDKHGVVVDNMPQNLKQFSQAIDQTKKIVFEQYDSLRQAAGKGGATIDLTGIATELSKIGKSKVIQTTKPSIARYASEMAESFRRARKYTAEEAQQAIAMYNEALEGFYKNPDYHTTSRAYVDSLVVNNLRKSLDNAIMNATGESYQALKNKYGALKAIERDVNHRTVIDARRNIKGLLDFSDIYSGYHVVRGVLSMEPSTAIAGGASKAIAWIYKLRNDPNKIIKTMFKDTDKILNPPSVVRKSITPIVTGSIYGARQSGEPKPRATLVPNGRR